MAKRSKKQTQEIVILNGCEVHKIEADYFAREARENAMERGLDVEIVENTYGEIERMIHRNNKRMEDVEWRRCPLYDPNNEYDGGDEEERELGREWYVKDRNRRIITL